MSLKNVLILNALMVISTSVFALEMHAYKDGGSDNVTLSDKSVEDVWNTNAPACLKDGSKILGVNKVFKSMGLGYRDCSQGVAAKRKHKALGYAVTVIKLSELSDAKIKEVLKK